MIPARPVASSFTPALAIALGLAVAAEAYTPRSATGRSTGKAKGGRQSASGQDFPSWERDVSASELSPLPTGRPGHYVPVTALDVGGIPVGVVSLGGGLFAAALAEGGVKFVDAAGALVGEAATPACTLPPVALDGSALIVSGSTLHRIEPSRTLWTHEAAAAIAAMPAVADPVIACALADGSIELLDAGTGHPMWTSSQGSPAAAAPRILRSVVVAALGDGSVIGLDRETGAELWRTSVGESAGALVADEDAAWVAGRGPSSRTKPAAPIVVRIPLADAGRRLASGGRNWRLRVGGECAAAPILLDDLVAFTCHDGYIHAVDRTKGVGGWKTDLPARTRHPPLLAGGRLEFVLDQARHVVAIAAGNGAVLGWSELADEDEIFVGPAAWAANVTMAGTNLGRLVLLRWEWDEKPVEEEDADPRGPGQLGATSVRER